MTYKTDEQQRAAGWKQRSATLPDAARDAAPYVNKEGTARGPAYNYCLPTEFADHSLLPEVRDAAIQLFSELGIPWHAGVQGGPSNHLLSSQVQCVNALGQMVSDPDRLVRAFAPVVNTAEVLEIEPGRYLTFEYIGPHDFFGEAPRGERIRGAHCTSVDAAFLHRTTDGVVELVLVEWKYTEAYSALKHDSRKDAERHRRYAAAIEDPSGPIRAGLLPFSCLLDEPIYQLMRQQLLVHELQKAKAEGADRVRLVHVSPAGNSAYQQSLAQDEHRVLGATVSEVWHQLLRHHDQFISLDSNVFCDPAITSPEYVSRYAA